MCANATPTRAGMSRERFTCRADSWSFALTTSSRTRLAGFWFAVSLDASPLWRQRRFARWDFQARSRWTAGSRLGGRPDIRWRLRRGDIDRAAQSHSADEFNYGAADASHPPPNAL